MLCLTILVLTALWLLSFFGQSIFTSLPLTDGFINMLAVVIVILIIVQFLS
jgi:hypothetical protein